MLSDRCPVCLSVLSVTFVHCGQTAGRIKMKLGAKVRLRSGHIVLDWDPATSLTGAQLPPQFLAHICRGQMAARIKMPLGMELGLSHMLDGDPTPPPQKGGGAPLPNFPPTFIGTKRLDGSRWYLAWR